MLIVMSLSAFGCVFRFGAKRFFKFYTLNFWIPGSYRLSRGGRARRGIASIASTPLRSVSSKMRSVSSKMTSNLFILGLTVAIGSFKWWVLGRDLRYQHSPSTVDTFTHCCHSLAWRYAAWLVASFVVRFARFVGTCTYDLPPNDTNLKFSFWCRCFVKIEPMISDGAFVWWLIYEDKPQPALWRERIAYRLRNRTTTQWPNSNDLRPKMDCR